MARGGSTVAPAAVKAMISRAEVSSKAPPSKPKTAAKVQPVPKAQANVPTARPASAKKSKGVPTPANNVHDKGVPPIMQRFPPKHLSAVIKPPQPVLFYRLTPSQSQSRISYQLRKALESKIFKEEVKAPRAPPTEVSENGMRRRMNQQKKKAAHERKKARKSRAKRIAKARQ